MNTVIRIVKKIIGPKTYQADGSRKTDRNDPERYRDSNASPCYMVDPRVRGGYFWRTVGRIFDASYWPS